MNSLDFYQKHLDGVSRSFAYCIARLDTPLRSWVSLTYLVCRILDTVEDARWPLASAQMEKFDQFNRFLLDPRCARQMGDWCRSFPAGVSPQEQDLLREAEFIFTGIHELPPLVRGPIQDLVLSMASGMRHFAERKIEGVLKVSNLYEVNQYCFFVAGVVGEALVNLLAAVESRVTLNRDLVRDSHHFGLFLQKVNLLKDQFKDELEGRFLISERREVFASLFENARGALRYIEAVPLEQGAYRAFCLSSLFLGLATLPLLQDQGCEPKLSREDAMALFAEIEAHSQDPVWVRENFDRLVEMTDLGGATFGDKGTTMSPSESLDDNSNDERADISWFWDAYRGILQEPDLVALGVV